MTSSQKTQKQGHGLLIIAAFKILGTSHGLSFRAKANPVAQFAGNRE